MQENSIQEKIGKSRRSMARYIQFVLLFSTGFGILLYFLVRSPACAISGGIGFCFLVLLLVNRYSVFHYRREGVHTSATVIACEPIRMGDEAGKRGEKFYKVTYEVMYREVPVIVEVPSEERIKVGKRESVYYIAGKNVFRTDQEMEEYRSSKGLLVLTLLFFAVGVMFGIVEHLAEGELPEEFWEAVFLFGISLVLTGIGIVIIFLALRQKREIAEAYRTPAVLVRYDIRREEDEDDIYEVYIPVWEYEYRGKKKEYKGNGCKGEEQEIGTVSEVMVTAKGKTYEQGEGKVSFQPGIMITVLGIAVLVLAVFTLCW